MVDFSINEMQRRLQDKYKDQWEPICPETGKNKMLWMIGEIGEVIDIIKKNGAIQASSDVTADELKQIYNKKFQKNMERW